MKISNYYKHKWKMLFGLVFGLALSLVAVASVHAQVATTLTTSILDSSNNATTSADVGSVVRDVATVTAPATTTVVTGTVNFSLFPNTTCSGTSTAQSTGGVYSNSAGSASATVPSTGLSFSAHYSDPTAVFSPADSPCEPLSATATSSLASTSIATVLSSSTITASSTAFDTATLSGATANASGNVAYIVYDSPACSAAVVGAGVVPVTNGVVPNSLSVLFPSAGTYYWQATYSGDSNNLAATSTCQNEVLNVTASSGGGGTTTPVTISTALSSSNVVASSSVNDTATLQNATANATGTVVYTVFGDNACSISPMNAGTVSVTNATVPNSDSLLFSAPGTFYWQATYSGDANNNAATSTCQNEVLTVTATSTGTTTSGIGSISGTVYNDLNRSGTLNSGEPLLSGWTINLYSGAGWSGPTNKAPIMTTVSDANGHYMFNNLADGVYSVEEINQPSLNQFTSDFRRITITNGALIVGKDFGNVAGNPYSNGHQADIDHDKDNRGHNYGGGQGFGFGNNATSTSTTTPNWQGGGGSSGDKHDNFTTAGTSSSTTGDPASTNSGNVGSHGNHSNGGSGGNNGNGRGNGHHGK